MDKLTIDDIQKIATILEARAGITMVVMPNEFAKKGVSILLMHPDDVEQITSILKPRPDPLSVLREAKI